MRKFASLFVMAILCSMLVFAQNRNVSGTVTDANGKPVPFASITVKGSNIGANADADGKFALRNVPSGSTLVISSVGFDTKEVAIGTSDVISISITSTVGSMSEVVVTSAFGIKKSARVTPFSAQVISEEQLKIIPQSNINNALAGKVAGTQFRGQSSIKLASEGGFRVRGGQGLGDGGPIYVVDGTIVGSFDINPDDVEDVTFLKGVNSTTLYGGRAVNGVVVITTKKRGQANTVGIEFTQGVTVEKVYVMPKYQNVYGGGNTKDLIQYNWQAGQPIEWQALSGKYYHEFTDDASWGPRMVGQDYIPWYAWTGGHSRAFQTAKLLPQPDNARDFWETGINTFSNLSFAKSGPGFNSRISYTNNSVTGLLPNTSSEKHTVFGTLGLDLNQHFRAGLNVSVVNQKIRGQFDDGYANQSQGSFNQWFHRDIDMELMKELKDLKTPIGTAMSWNLRNNPGANVNNVYIGNYWYNFYTWFDRINFRQLRDRAFGDVFLQYKLNSNFNVKLTVRKSLLNLQFENITPSILQASAGQTGVFATYATGQRKIDEMNYELLASFNKKFIKKFDVSVNAGGNYMRFKDTRVEMSTRNGLNVPDLYAIANSKDDAILVNNRLREQQRAAFATGDFEWNRTFSATWAVRNDWYSTLAKGQNSILSYSFGGGIIFSEYTKTSMPWLSFGKVFGSWGKKPTTLNIYENNFLYEVNQNQWGTNYLIGTPNTLVDPSTQGALISTTEVGIDLRFLKNRLGLNVIYYWEDNDKAPVPVDIYGGSGFTRKVLNAAQIKREGIEVVLTARPVVSKNFNWELTKTFAYLVDNEVVSIADGVPRYLLGQSPSFNVVVPRVFLEAGKQWGQLIGNRIKRNDQGLMEINPTTGVYASEVDYHFGSVVPKTSGGLVNTFTYKGLVLNLSIDYQVGGKFFSLSEMWGHYSGLMEATAAVNDRGMNVRDDIADGGGVHVIGVSSVDHKTPVDLYVDAQTYYHQFYNSVYDPYVHDLTYVKLREVSLGYQIPVSKWKVGKVVKGATVSVVSRNPWLIYRESKNFDPSEISQVQGEDGQYPGTRSLGVNLKLNF